jgi:hypothetical protein
MYKNLSTLFFTVFGLQTNYFEKYHPETVEKRIIMILKSGEFFKHVEKVFCTNSGYSRSSFPFYFTQAIKKGRHENRPRRWLKP